MTDAGRMKQAADTLRGLALVAAQQDMAGLLIHLDVALAASLLLNAVSGLAPPTTFNVDGDCEHCHRGGCIYSSGLLLADMILGESKQLRAQDPWADVGDGWAE